MRSLFFLLNFIIVFNVSCFANRRPSVKHIRDRISSQWDLYNEMNLSSFQQHHINETITNSSSYTRLQHLRGEEEEEEEIIHGIKSRVLHKHDIDVPENWTCSDIYYDEYNNGVPIDEVLCDCHCGKDTINFEYFR